MFKDEDVIKVFDEWDVYEENWFIKLVQVGLLTDADYDEFMEWVENQGE